MVRPGATPDDVAAMLAWINPEAFLQGLIREIDATHDASRAMSAAERRDTVRDFREIAMRLERHEETRVRMALSTGLDVQRRIGVSPEALLGVVVAATSRRRAA